MLDRLSHYEIASKIGQGGMGAVYRAVDLRLNRTVAIKVLPAEATSDASRKRRFVQEAQSASGLNHPNIVSIYDIDSDAGVDFIAMELADGDTLDRVIARGSADGEGDSGLARHIPRPRQDISLTSVRGQSLDTVFAPAAQRVERWTT